MLQYNLLCILGEWQSHAEVKAVQWIQALTENEVVAESSYKPDLSDDSEDEDTTSKQSASEQSGNESDSDSDTEHGKPITMQINQFSLLSTE